MTQDQKDELSLKIMVMANKLGKRWRGRVLWLTVPLIDHPILKHIEFHMNDEVGVKLAVFPITKARPDITMGIYLNTMQDNDLTDLYDLLNDML
jgi:hypothetical protein